MTIRVHDAIAQLARFWMERTSLVLRYSDPLVESDLTSNVFTAPMPPLAHREALACSLTTDSPADVQRSMVVIDVRCEAHAPSMRSARELLEDLRSVIMPGHRPIVPSGPFNDGDEVLVGLIGFSPVVRAAADGDSVGLWKTLALDLVTNVQDLSPHLGPGSTEQGQASAVMVVRMLAVPVTRNAPETAFEITRDGGMDETTTVIIDETGITLDTAGMVVTTVHLDFTAYTTVAALAAAVDALPEWSTNVIDASFDARPSRSVFASGEHNALGSDVPVRVWA